MCVNSGQKTVKINQDEQYWIRQLHKGSNAALSYFFDLHHKALYYFAFNLVQDILQAEDIVSESYLKIWERRESFETEQNIKAFLYITCRNACLNHIKARKRENTSQENYLHQKEFQEEAIVNKIIKSEVLDSLHREIEQLPEKCKEIFKLIYFEDMKTDEIAKLLNLSVQTVRNQKVRARELLRSSILRKGISENLFLLIILHLSIN